MNTTLPSKERGVTLIEVLIALLIIAVSVVALASMSVNSFETSYSSTQRLAASFFAEQIMESWQYNPSDFPPSIDGACNVSQGAAAASYPIVSKCTLSIIGASPLNLKVIMDTSNITAPIPLAGAISDQPLTTPPGYTLTPRSKWVKISWTDELGQEDILLFDVTAVR